METLSLTIQAYLNQSWQDVAVIKFDDAKRLSSFTYLTDYAMQHFLSDNKFATSINYPVEFFDYSVNDSWLPFLDDLIPAGASKRYWLQRLDLTRLSKDEQNYELLKHATIAPVGHLRIKESVSTINTNTPKKFQLTDIINRDVDFLEYASENGAMAGGATGAGGEAPKLLLRWHDDDNIWIDNLQLGDNPDKYYLVKYPRGNRKEIDSNILRAEYYFYHELSDMGLSTIDVEHMRLIEGERYPSLWLPRFDVINDNNGVTQRLAMESVYSMLKKGAGSYLKHKQVIQDILTVIQNSQLVQDGFNFDEQQFVIEWVRRDLLNIAFGNSDNHGRNTAFLRDDKSIWLAPIYDFAPMKADPEGIVRTIKWSDPNHKLESGGEYRFDLIAQSLDEFISPEQLMSELKMTAHTLLELKKRLEARGVPKQIFNYPSINYGLLPEKLKKWRLLS